MGSAALDFFFSSQPVDAPLELMHPLSQPDELLADFPGFSSAHCRLAAGASLILEQALFE